MTRRAILPTPSIPVLAGILCLLALSGCGDWGYGDLQDHSVFHQARFLGGPDQILFTVHLYRYRPAVGLRAFPNGGIPRYVTDRHLVALHERTSGRTRVLVERQNRKWSHGQGKFSILDQKNPLVLLVQSGQRRGTLKVDRWYWFLHAESGTLERIPLETELHQRGRAMGYVHLVAPDGTLVLITPSREEKQRYTHWNRKQEVIPEIWVRRPNGSYTQVASNDHYQAYRNNRVIYWDPESRDFLATDVDTGRTRRLPRYQRRDRPQPSWTAEWDLDVRRRSITLRQRREHGSGNTKGTTIDLPVRPHQFLNTTSGSGTR